MKNYRIKPKQTCINCRHIRYDLTAAPFCDGIGKLDGGAEHKENRCRRWKEGSGETFIQILKTYETEEIPTSNN